MDKTLKRKIGYKRPAQTIKTKKEVQKPAGNKVRAVKVASVPKNAPETPQKATAQDIYKFLREHPLIKIGGLCKVIRSDKSNFYTSMKNGHNLPQEKIDKIVEILKNYGWSG